MDIKYKSGNRVNALKNQPWFNPSFAAASKSKDTKYLHQKNANDFSFRSFNNGVSSLRKMKRSVMPMDEGQKDDFLHETLEKMAIPFEKLEKLFSEKLYPHEPAENTIKRLCSIVTAALAMPDPIRYTQDMFTYYNRQYYSAKMILYVAASYRIDTFGANMHLKNVLMEKYL
jgi:hypothetical protein